MLRAALLRTAAPNLARNAGAYALALLPGIRIRHLRPAGIVPTAAAVYSCSQRLS